MVSRGCLITHSQREIEPVCDPCATAIAANNRYSAARQHRVHAMMSYVVSEGRLFELKASEWAIMLVGVALCGLIALLF